MKITLHGGDCCGIKVISSLGYYPALIAAARKATKMTSFGQYYNTGVNDMRRNNPRGKYDFFNLAAPKETYEERLRRFVAFIKDNRPHGLIEVTLTTSYKLWLPVLEELGFKRVSKFKNSNTGSVIYVYHLAY